MVTPQPGKQRSRAVECECRDEWGAVCDTATADAAERDVEAHFNKKHVLTQIGVTLHYSRRSGVAQQIDILPNLPPEQYDNSTRSNT